MLEGFLTFLVGICVLMDNPADDLECHIVEMFYSITGVWCILLCVTRFAYLYVTILKDNINNGYLYKISELLLDPTNQSQIDKGHMYFFGVVLSSISGIYSLGYYILLSKVCGYNFTAVAAVMNYIGLIFVTIYGIQVVRNKVKDNIGMSTELLGNVICMWLMFVVYLCWSISTANSYYWLPIGECLVNILFCLYFPILKLLHIKYRKRKPNSKIEILQEYDLHLHDVCKHCQCQEISKFIDKYAEYNNKKYKFEEIVQQFIVVGSKFELNIDYNLKRQILELHDGMEVEHNYFMEQIFLEVRVLIVELELQVPNSHVVSVTRP